MSITPKPSRRSLSFLISSAHKEYLGNSILSTPCKKRKLSFQHVVQTTPKRCRQLPLKLNTLANMSQHKLLTPLASAGSTRRNLLHDLEQADEQEDSFSNSGHGDDLSISSYSWFDEYFEPIEEETDQVKQNGLQSPNCSGRMGCICFNGAHLIIASDENNNAVPHDDNLGLLGILLYPFQLLINNFPRMGGH